MEVLTILVLQKHIHTLENLTAIKHYSCWWGAWVPQLVKRLTLGFGSGHGLLVCEFKPRIGLCADSVEPAWDSLCLPLPLPPPVLSLSLNK